MNYRYIFIDADDTVFDYKRAETESLKKTIICAGLNCRIEEAVLKYSAINGSLWKRFEKGEVSLGYLRKERFRRLLGASGRERVSHEECERISGIYLDELSNSGCLIDGAYEMLEKVSVTHTLVLVTNGISKVQRQRLRRAGIEKFFSAVVISEEIGYKKPEKEYFRKAMEAAGEPEKESVLVVGDSLSGDIQGGINYGLDTCWFNREKKKNITGIVPKYEISDYEELYLII